MFVQPPNKCWVESEILRFYEVISLLQLNPSATGRGGSWREGMGRVGDLEPGLFFSARLLEDTYLYASK